MYRDNCCESLSRGDLSEHDMIILRLELYEPVKTCRSEIPACLATQKTWFGKRVLNNFTWFYNTHMLMFLIFFVAIMFHPMPGVPGFSNVKSHQIDNSITWVCPLPL